VVSEKLISPNQTTFIKGRYILESVVSAHEVIHDVVHKGQTGFIFKLDYEKSYDRVDRDFLLRVMKMRGSSPKWMSVIEGLLHNGSVGVRINDCNSQFFLTSRGLRQGILYHPFFSTLWLMFSLRSCIRLLVEDR
jgi:hypothetical protein